MNRDSPLVSCLCVTEGRAAFMPWLLWGFERQTWPNKELVVVDSSPAPWACAATEGSVVRVLTAPPGTNVPRKRNLALQAARGCYVAWFDDDDWQHPDRLERIGHALSAGAAVAGSTSSFFVDMFTSESYRYTGRGQVIFNGAGFVAEAARAVRFDEQVSKASDMAWIDAVVAGAAGRVTVFADAVHTFWLCHDGNLSNPRGRLPLCFPIALVRNRVGSEAWGDTDEQLRALAERVRAASPGSVAARF